MFGNTLAERRREEIILKLGRRRRVFSGFMTLTRVLKICNEFYFWDKVYYLYVNIAD